MNSRAYFYLAITALFWGGNSVAGKMAVGHVSPMMLTTCAGSSRSASFWR
ncbi:putative permease of the drug/metabolite transporter (DMT) superfamily [Sinorhizobium fredii HH103]|uniref:Permease of the drug/metabolite transporter (DMT) superfamily n=1 Tax=Sinorhizobium fredii (strain HH103) TaxID=1117943 RepID=G9ABE1_SINF1|nr:putative permease of the drug/metabolite transporter (DMT) superfamily [Sinorhizobium fredii HH103]